MKVIWRYENSDSSHKITLSETVNGILVDKAEGTIYIEGAKRLFKY